MADNIDTKGATAVPVATDQVTYSGDANQHVQLVRIVQVTGSEGSKTVVDLPGDSTTGLRVNSIGFFKTAAAGEITRPGTTPTYALNAALSDGSSPTSGGFTIANAARASGRSGIITDAIITSDFYPTGGNPLLMGEIWLFDRAVTAIGDTNPFQVQDSELGYIVGKIPFTLENSGNSLNQFCPSQNLNIGFTCSGSADLRFLVKVKNAYVAGSGEKINVRLKIIQTD